MFPNIHCSGYQTQRYILLKLIKLEPKSGTVIHAMENIPQFKEVVIVGLLSGSIMFESSHLKYSSRAREINNILILYVF